MLMNQSSNPSLYRAEALHLSKGEKVTLLIEGSAIIFIKKGKITPFFDGFSQRPLPSGQLFFLPPGVLCVLESPLEDSGVMVLQIPDIAVLCHRFFPGTIFKKSSLPEDIFHPLAMDKYLHGWLDNMYRYIEDGWMDNLIVEIKALELFHLLKTMYPEECVSRLLSPVDENDYRFVLFVYQNYASVKTMEDLACLSPYSLSGFEKQFRRVFGIAPYRWMLKQKTENIYKEIYGTSKPLKLIAEEFGFAGLAQLGNFCRQHLGFSPKTIRGRYEK